MAVCIDGNNFSIIAYTSCNKYEGDDFEGAVYNTLATMLGKLKSKFSGDFYVCWDTRGGTTFRKELNSDYKATRKPGMIDFSIINRTKSLYDDYGVKSINVPACEGDDALYVLCKCLRERKPQDVITIVSRDRDMLQIVQAGWANQVWDPVTKEAVPIPMYDIVKFKAIAGDTSDNIKGVKGIGKAGALKILDGLRTLTESQQKEYEESLKLVDATLNPNFEKNYEFVKNILSEM
jgi:DNA polymerase I